MTTTLNLSFGTVRAERTDGPAHKPWITAYEVTGPRISGTVEIAPTYDESIIGEYRREIPNETDWELLPSAFSVAYGRNTWSGDGVSGSLVVNGSRLVGWTVVRTKSPFDWTRFSVRRAETGIGDYPAPPGATSRTREVVEALMSHHRENDILVHEQAIAYARSKQTPRLVAIEKEAREIEELLQALNARAGTLTMRRIQMSGRVFEKTLTDLAPTTA
ncbi:hypothetical protein [Streptomyces antarcticus]|uniref:hypothetical protein n=1 Tax=Streptomyces antarcticus TaxID=2996458 RepID=UPI00226E0857|nr:hypothetical protein [Streptomyces sp. H34-AA3]MCY0946803.1 hypothetical protein [Streptomyces sp. H34-AA3]